MFGFKKKEKNLEKEKKPAKGKKPLAESAKELKIEGQPAKKSFFKKIFSLKFMIIFIIIIIILAGAGVAGWYFFLKKDSDKKEQAATEESNKTEKGGEVDKDGKPILPPEPDFPDIVDLEKFEKIKLQESESFNYLTLKISLEIVNPEMRKDIEADNEKIRQTVESEIKKTNWLILRTSEGKLNFKYRIIQELNKSLNSKMIRNIYFTTFIVQ